MPLTPWEHNEGRPASMKDVEAILRELSNGERSNPPVLAINNRNLMKARNNGYPKEMYHATLEPILVINEAQEAKMGEMGYVSHYIKRDYPRWLHRRNMSKKFALQIDPATGNPKNSEFVESIIVQTKAKHDALLKMPVPKNCGPWVKTEAEIAPLDPDDVEETTPAKSRRRAA